MAQAYRRLRWTASGRAAKMAGMRRTVFVFDLDGTLVDSVYQHVLAWQEALEREEIQLSVWRIHRRMGMSGGLFVGPCCARPVSRSTPGWWPGSSRPTPRPTGA